MVKNPWYQNDQVWGKINEVHYLQALQGLHKLWAKGKLETNDAARKTVVDKYSIKECKSTISSRFSAIRNGMGHSRREKDAKTEAL
jgi:hypothetical protein